MVRALYANIVENEHDGREVISDLRSTKYDAGEVTAVSDLWMLHTDAPYDKGCVQHDRGYYDSKNDCWHYAEDRKRPDTDTRKNQI